MLDLLMGTGVGFANHVMESSFDSAMQDRNDAKHQNREFNYNQKTMASQQIRELQNLQNSPSAYIQGLKKAGINPALLASGQIPVGQSTALATSGSGHAVPGTSGALQAASAAVMAKKQSDLLSSEVELNESTAAKNRSEARQVDIENQHSESRDSLLSSSMRAFLTEMVETTDNDFIRGYLEKMLEENKEFDAGSVRGFSEMFFEFSQKERDRELDYIAKEMDKKVKRLALADDAIAESIARRPYDDRVELYKRMALMNMQIYSLAAESSLTENKREHLQAQVANLNAMTTKLYHSDPAAMWQAGDYSAFFSALAYDGVNSAANGFGFGAGAAFGSRVGGTASGALRTRLDAGSSAGKAQTEVFKGALKGKSPQLKQSQVARLRKELAAMKSDGTKYLRPKVYQDKLDELMRAKYGM